MQKINLINKLFKKEFIIIFLIFFIGFFIVGIISVSINIYNHNLEKTFATKQPHIIIDFLQNTYITSKDKSLLYDEVKQNFKNSISSVNVYKKNIDIVKLTSYNNINISSYKGKVTLIGLDTDIYPQSYNFFDIEPLSNDIDVKLSGIELFDIFKSKSNIVFFNETLHEMLEPIVTHISNFKVCLSSKQNYEQIKYYGIIQDYKDKAILYTNYRFLNKLFKNEPNMIDGLMVNIKNQKQLNNIKNKLKKFFKGKNIQVNIKTWREINKKQDQIFKTFIVVGGYIKYVLLSLSIMAILMYFYKSLVQKQPSIRIIYMLGFDMKLFIIVILILVVLLSIFLSIIVTIYFCMYYFNLGQIPISFYIYDFLSAGVVSIVAIATMVYYILKSTSKIKLIR